MENLFPSVLSLQQRFHDEGIPSNVIDGLAVAAWGEPRLTRDVDLKISLTLEDTDRLLSILSTDFTFLGDQPAGILQKKGLIFVQDAAGTRLGIMLADTPYDVLAIERTRDVEIRPGITVRVCTPEDLIIYKIISTRQRDHQDIKGVIRRQGNTLDDDYVISWLQQFDEALDDSTLIDEYTSFRKKLSNN